MHTLSKLGVVTVGAVAAWAVTLQSVGAVIGRHNMSTRTPDARVCLPCHAPHKLPGTILIWNHTLSAANFSWSDATATTGGTALPTNIKTWSGSSKTCFACHDGTVDIGSIYSPPINFDAVKIAASAQMGPDLKGNHPVSVPYPYNNAKNTYNGVTTGSVLTLTEYQAAPTGVRVFIDSGQAGPNNRGIECASCHDPHGTGYPKYLRLDTKNSAICLACHVK